MLDHEVSDRAVEFEHALVLLVEDGGGVHILVQFAEPFKSAPESGVQLQGLRVVLNGFFLFLLLFGDEAQEVQPCRAVRNVPRFGGQCLFGLLKLVELQAGKGELVAVLR